MSENNHNIEYDFEDSFAKSLKSLGYLFPTTEDEVEFFEENNLIEKTPQHYSSASDLLSKERKVTITKKIEVLSNKSAENLARAARNGSGISEEILRKMKDDRNNHNNGE